MIFVCYVKPRKSLTKVSDEKSWGNLFCIKHFNTRDFSQGIIRISQKSYISKVENKSTLKLVNYG